MGISDTISLRLEDIVLMPEAVDLNFWFWYLPVKVEDGSVFANVNIFGHFISYFLLVTTALQIIGLFCGERTGPMKVSKYVENCAQIRCYFSQEIMVSFIGFLSLMVVGGISLSNAVDLDDFKDQVNHYSMAGHKGMAATAIITSLLYLLDFCIHVSVTARGKSKSNQVCNADLGGLLVQHLPTLIALKRGKVLNQQLQNLSK